MRHVDPYGPVPFVEYPDHTDSGKLALCFAVQIFPHARPDEGHGVRVDLPRDGAVLRRTHVVGVVAVVGG